MKKKSRVLVFGVFDILHPGHLLFLQRARQLADTLIVVVTRDARALAEKGKPPIFNEQERLHIIAGIGVVSKTRLGDRPGQWTVLRRLHPDVLAVGHDQKVSKEAKDGPWKIVRIAARNRRRYSTSRIRKSLERTLSTPRE